MSEDDYVIMSGSITGLDYPGKRFRVKKMDQIGFVRQKKNGRKPNNSSRRAGRANTGAKTRTSTNKGAITKRK
jgi:hypothetical protein